MNTTPKFIISKSEENMQKDPKSSTRIKIGLETPLENNLRLMAYAFDQSGRLLESQSVEKEQVTFKLSERVLRTAQVFVVPIPEGLKVIPDTLAGIKRLQPFQPVFDLDRPLAELFVPNDFIYRWYWRFCRATGRVTKRFNIDGVLHQRPLCQARVHICEVDRLRIFWEIPDLELVRIPDLIRDLERLRPRRPFPPIPEPEPFFGGRPTLPQLRTFALQAAPPLATPMPVMERSEVRQHLLSLHADLREQLLSGEPERMRSALSNNFTLLHPLLCYLPSFWPYLYRCNEITTVLTDANGRFDVPFLYPASDQPDLYFWVEYMIGGVWTTVYRPHLPCNIHWNYACGTEVNINVTDSRVPYTSCGDVLPGTGVWIRTLGNLSVRAVEQNDLTETVQGQAFRTIGLTKWGDAQNIHPFGSNLHFWVLFGDALPTTNIGYYRWSYRQLRTGGLFPIADGWHPITTPMTKSYTIANTLTLDPNDRVTLSFELGPKPNSLYRIPPAEATVAEVSGSNATARWDNNNTLSIALPTADLPDGLFEIKMELFDNSGALVEGSPFNYQLPTVADPTASEAISAPYSVPGIAAGTVSAFHLLVRIDNNVCGAEILPVQLVADPSRVQNCCGFLNYNNDAQLVRVAFRATHPNDLAAYSFSTVKGQGNNNGVATASTSGLILNGQNGFIRSGNVFYKNIIARDLLGSCDGHACTKAAFGEHLVVSTLAVDGYSRLQYLDRADLDSYALEP